MSFTPLSIFYAGNRSGVLHQILNEGHNVVKVASMPDSWLEKEMRQSPSIDHFVATSKNSLVDRIENTDFDVFVSVGCYYILPITKLKSKKRESIFVNIHPSFLPDLAGRDPIPAAVLFRRDSGVTCHHMTDEIDKGPIIAQDRIKYTRELDSILLYKLCFSLEPTVFSTAIKKKFVANTVHPSKNSIYYSFSAGDNLYSLGDIHALDIVARVNAFNTKSRLFKFQLDNKFYSVKYATMVDPALNLVDSQTRESWRILFSFENNAIITNNIDCVRLHSISPSLNPTHDGKYLIVPNTDYYAG